MSPTNGGGARQRPPDTRAEREYMTISEAFEAYRLVCVFKNQSPKTEENLLVCKRALLAYFGNPPIRNLSFELIRMWKTELEKTRTPETVRNYIIKLRVVLRYCRNEGIKVIDPETIPVPQRRDKVPVFITEEEVTKLITNTGCVRNKAIISLLYASGVRVSELCRINKEDIHDGCFTVLGKGGKARLCFIDQRTQVYLTEYLNQRTDNQQALFTGKHSCDRITPGNVQEIFRYARTKANFTKPIHPHTLRHSFATNLLRNNANIRYVQTLLGHASLETTQMYTHVTDNDLKKVYIEHHTV